MHHFQLIKKPLIRSHKICKDRLRIFGQNTGMVFTGDRVRKNVTGKTGLTALRCHGTGSWLGRQPISGMIAPYV